MKDSRHLPGSRSVSQPGAAPKPAQVPGGPARPAARPASTAPAKGEPRQAQPTTGKVVHDERGNAVWDWLKQTGRNAIESTTRMLRKLEAPELQVEQPAEEELRIQPDSGNSSGGGYDPYNQPIKSRRTPTK